MVACIWTDTATSEWMKLMEALEVDDDRTTISLSDRDMPVWHGTTWLTTSSSWISQISSGSSQPEAQLPLLPWSFAIPYHMEETSILMSSWAIPFVSAPPALSFHFPFFLLHLVQMRNEIKSIINGIPHSIPQPTLPIPSFLEGIFLP